MNHPAGHYRDLQTMYGTDAGPHEVNGERYATFAVAIDAYDDARRHSAGHRYLRNLTTGELIDSDQQGWRRENWAPSTWQRFGLDPKYHG